MLIVRVSTGPWVMEAVGACAGIYFFVRGFLILQRRQLIRNTPASKLRSASLGLVEVSGLATGPYTLTAPITGATCYCYRTVAWRLEQAGKNKEWKKVAEESLHVPFFLDDNTGKVLVDPRGAELDIHRDFHQEYSDNLFSSHDLVPLPVSDFLMRHGVSADGKSVRIDEFCVKPKNFLFILGTLAENQGTTLGPAPLPNGNDGRLPFEQEVANHLFSPSFSWSAPLDTLAPASLQPNASAGTMAVEHPTGSGPAASPPAMTQQGKIAAALMRAGITNPAAWKAAGLDPTAGVAHVEEPFGDRSEASSPPESWDPHPPVVLMKGTNNPAFLISWRSQGAVLNSLAWKSTLMIWGGPALTLVCLYLLAAQLGWL
jgi:hypothetical protein